MTTALITGCSSGIGLASAVEFARQGCDVVATMRDLDRSQPLRDALAAAGVSAEICALDVSDGASVDALAARLGAVDVVVSNAGIGIDGSTEELTIDDFRRSFETNVLGSVRLLHAVLPTWRERGSGRFIAVSSVAGAVGQPFNDAYCMSKFALEGLLESLHPVIAQFGIHVSLVEPGPVAGDFADKYAPGQGRDGDSAYAESYARFKQVQAGGFATAQTNDEIAAFLWQVAGSETPVLRYQTSELVEKLVGLKLKDMTGERITGLTARWV